MKRNTVFLMILTALITCLVTNTIRDIKKPVKNDIFSEKTADVMKKIKDFSIYDFDETKAADYASQGIAASLNDPYTTYYPKDDFESLMTNIHDSYIGIGIIITADTSSNKLVVVSPIENQTAEKHGILPGDLIIAVDGVPYTAQQMDEAVSVIKGQNLEKVEGTSVTLTIERDGKTSDYTIPREKISRESVSSKILDNNTGYIRITQFNSKNTQITDSKDTYSEFLEHIKNLQNQNISSLIIDLRNNPGGDLNVVCNIADYLLPEGIITYTENKHGKRENYESDANSINIPIAVLVNNASASASEVLSGALKDYNKGTLIGEKTFGKGVVQLVLSLDDGSGLSITSAKYYTPSGECIHEKGIEPHIAVELDSEKSISQLTLEEDLQLQKALEVLSKK